MRELLKNFTILYVEDDIDTNEVISSILKSNFKEVYSAFNGEEGLEAYKINNPDIVLSDIQMPKMNGIEMSKAIKEINPHQEIALFTAFNEPEHLKKAVNMGISKYILKPIDDTQFFDSLLSMAKVIQTDKDHEIDQHCIEIQSKNSAVGEMLGYIAHQWRQPLSIMSAILNGIKVSMELEKTIKQEDLEELITTMNKQIKYLSDTIDDFSNFFHTSNIVIKEFEFNDLYKDIMSLTKDMFQGNKINVVINAPENITIKQDKNSLLHAILNIINNSKDAFLDKKIDTKSRYLFIDANKSEEDLLTTITIRDSAGGIEEEIIDRIFQPYTTTKFQDQGTGIGMYMTYQIINKHFKGNISVNNHEYKYNDKQLRGAEFKLAFKDSECD